MGNEKVKIEIKEENKKELNNLALKMSKAAMKMVVQIFNELRVDHEKVKEMFSKPTPEMTKIIKEQGLKLNDVVETFQYLENFKSVHPNSENLAKSDILAETGSLFDEFKKELDNMKIFQTILKIGFDKFTSNKEKYFESFENRIAASNYLSTTFMGLYNYEKYLKDQGLDPNASLLHFRFLEYPHQTYWLFNSVSSGAVHAAIREMRFILESWVRGYYIDRKYSNLNLKEKIDKQKGLKFNSYKRKGVLIEEGCVERLLPTLREKVKILWKKLNSFTHPDPSELDRLKLNSLKGAIFEFTKTDLKICLDHLKKLLDIFSELSGFDSLIKNPTRENIDRLRTITKQLHENISIQKLIENSDKNERISNN